MAAAECHHLQQPDDSRIFEKVRHRARSRDRSNISIAVLPIALNLPVYFERLLDRCLIEDSDFLRLFVEHSVM